MTDNRSNHPLDPMEDQALDRYLASLGRFGPGPGFEDRVMARVRVSAPARAPVPAPAPSIAARVVRSRRWPVLAYSFSGLAAASSTALTAWVAANFSALTASAWAGLVEVAVPTWQSALNWLTLAVTSLSPQLWAWGWPFAGDFTPLISLLVIMSLPVPLSFIGLWLVARAPQRMRSHVAR